jgi:hypothetical protein
MTFALLGLDFQSDWKSGKQYMNDARSWTSDQSEVLDRRHNTILDRDIATTVHYHMSKQTYRSILLLLPMSQETAEYKEIDKG